MTESLNHLTEEQQSALRAEIYTAIFYHTNICDKQEAYLLESLMRAFEHAKTLRRETLAEEILMFAYKTYKQMGEE